METVEIHLWDDLDARAGNRVESDQQVTLEYSTKRGSRRVRLDLTDEHAKELEEVLARWLDAGQRPREQASAHGHQPGSAAARQFYAGLRDWAKAEGRDGEHWTSGKGGRARQLYYPRQLVADYREHLRSLAERQAG
jgi:hypothetical protein